MGVLECVFMCPGKILSNEASPANLTSIARTVPKFCTHIRAEHPEIFFLGLEDWGIPGIIGPWPECQLTPPWETGLEKYYGIQGHFPGNRPERNSFRATWAPRGPWSLNGFRSGLLPGKWPWMPWYFSKPVSHGSHGIFPSQSLQNPKYRNPGFNT